MGYYDLTGSYIFQLAANYTLFDNFFASAFGGVMLNHLYLVSGQTPLWANTNSSCPNSVPGGQATTFPVFSSTTGQLASVTDKGIFTPWSDGCYIVNNIHPPTLGSAPNIPYPGLNQTHIGDLLSAAGVSVSRNSHTAALHFSSLPRHSPPIVLSVSAGQWAYYAESFNATIANWTVTNDYASFHEIPFMYYADNQVNSTGFWQHNRDAINFFTDLSSGQLPAVSWIKPNQVSHHRTLY